MQRRVREIEGDSLVMGELPLGCQYCTRGSKMVLFVTGLCNSSCFYCPLSQEKAEQDVVFADEMPVSDLKDILFEAQAIGAEGAGLSGGDPLCQLDRTTDYISNLKEYFGADFHTHLYTSQSNVEQPTLRRLIDAGLDEIRFHPMTKNWTGIESAISLGMNVGIEVPAIPGNLSSLKDIAQKAENIEVDFLNINELESSETNFDALVARNLRLKNLDSAAIEGSAELARETIVWAAENLESLNVHYCSSHFKDAIQMRNRLQRRLERTIREFEEPDEKSPLLILGIIRAPHGVDLDSNRLDRIEHILRTEFDVPSTLLNKDHYRKRIEIAAWILLEIAEDLKRSITGLGAIEMGIAEEYPSWDRLQTLFEPL
ncbi:MAG: radical SAM protein [Candidatus Hodarchaeota archaeon]